MTEAGVAFTRDWLDRYLKGKLGGDVAAVSLEKFGRGSSRETWFARYRDASGAEVAITLRADHPAGSVDPTPLDQEFFIYDRLGGAGLKVARALWWEDDPAWTPRPFYVREMIEGSWSVDCFNNRDPAFDDDRIAVAKEHIAGLAQVHAVDWRRLGFGERLRVPVDAADAAHAFITTARERYAQTEGEPVPLFFEACEWLEDRAPAAPRLCLCKGTNGLGEEVFKDGKLVALSDWEEVSIGDPAADFAFIQALAMPIRRDGRQIWGMEEALDYYREISGHTVALASVQYYQVMRALTLVVMTRNAAIISHTSPETATIRQVWTGTEVVHIGKHVLASALGLIPPLTLERFGELNDSVEMAGDTVQAA